MSVEGAESTRAVVEAYHRGWTNRRFGEAVALLAEDLKVEVPINSYPTRESFAQALAGFGSLVDHVELMADFADGDQAMLLYDMTVRGIGTMRIAEHFTIAGGRIIRLRQIHDTAPIRAAGLSGEVG